MSHRCPGPDCKTHVADHMLMCRPHWYQVPRDLRNDVWDTWQNGAGQGTMEHTKAILAAIASLKARQP